MKAQASAWALFDLWGGIPARAGPAGDSLGPWRCESGENTSIILGKFFCESLNLITIQGFVHFLRDFFLLVWYTQLRAPKKRSAGKRKIEQKVKKTNRVYGMTDSGGNR